MELSVVIPAFNEERGIGATLDELKAVLKSMAGSSEIILVDDGSSDRTAAIALAKGVKVISHSTNRGYGAALAAGFSAAKGRVLACLDADGTYPPSELPKLYAALRKSGAEMVVGSRMAGKNEGMPLLRKFGNRILSNFASFMLGVRVSDLSSGMRVLPKETLQKLLPLSHELDFTVNMTLEAASQKMLVVEVPIDYRHRAGESKLSASRHGLMFLKSIIRVVRDYEPLRLFLPISGFFVLVGVLGMLQLLARRLGGEQSTSITNGLIVTGALVLFGLQIFFFGIIADMIASRNKK